MDEIWKDILEYEGLYQVSNLGRVKSLERTIVYNNGRVHHYDERIKSTFKMSDGYYGVNLSKNKKVMIKKVARLVAIAFIPNPDNLPEVNHINEDKSDNSVSNLEWCSHSYNINYGTRNEKVGNHFIKKVYQYSIDGNLINTFSSLSEAASANECSIGHLSIACRKVKEGSSCCGYFFSYYPLTKAELEKAAMIKRFYILHRNRKPEYNDIKAL